MDDKKRAVEELAEALGNMIITPEGNWEHMGEGCRDIYRDGAELMITPDSSFKKVMAGAGWVRKDRVGDEVLVKREDVQFLITMREDIGDYEAERLRAQEIIDRFSEALEAGAS